MSVERIQQHFRDSAAVKLEALEILSMPIAAAIDTMFMALANGNRILACGNGGSAADAQHFAAELIGRFERERPGLPAIALSTDSSVLTAIANDYGYEDSFAYQLRAQSRPGDVLVVISSSGRSPNIVRALQWACENDLRTIALTGFDGGGARSLAEVAIHVDSTNYGIVEDLHQSVMHALAQYIRQSRMDADVIATTTF